MAHVYHHGRETAYRTVDGSGTGPPVCCVHGSGADGRVWRGQRRLADRRPVVSVDLSGHGRSDDVTAAPGYETLAAYVDDVTAVLADTGATVLIGNSLGGAVVLSLAIRRDIEISGLVLAGTGARLPVLEDLRVWLEAEFERALEFLHEPDRLFHDVDEHTLARSRELFRETGRSVTARDFETCHRFDVRESLDELSVPALAVVGEHDRLTPPQYHEQLATDLPECECATVADAAHAVMVEQPRAFDAAVGTLLDRLNENG